MHLLRKKSQRFTTKTGGDTAIAGSRQNLWDSKNFDIIGAGTPEPGERQEDKCT